MRLATWKVNTHQRSDLPEISRDPQMPLLILVAVRNDDVRARLGCDAHGQSSATPLCPCPTNERREAMEEEHTEFRYQVPAQKARAAKHRRDMARGRTPSRGSV